MFALRVLHDGRLLIVLIIIIMLFLNELVQFYIDIMKYVIYDQFHWQSKDHFVRIYNSFDLALQEYGFLKDAFPNYTLGLTDINKFNKLLNSYN